jgi:hypothetical protein
MCWKYSFLPCQDNIRNEKQAIVKTAPEPQLSMTIKVKTEKLHCSRKEREKLREENQVS